MLAFKSAELADLLGLCNRYMEPLSIKCCELVCFYFLFHFVFHLLLFLTVFSYRTKLCITHIAFFFAAQSLSVGRNGWKSDWKSDVTRWQCPHESRERGLYEGKSRTSKTRTGVKRLIFFSLPHSSYFLLILPVPMVVFA